MVEYVSVSDYYEVRLASLLTNVDKDIIVELYQPIIGSTSAMLYLNLLKQKRNEEDETIFSMEKLISTMQVSPGQILNARHELEAVGLLSTFEKKNEENRSYIFILYAPKTPKDFFDDVLFKGLLIQSVGQKEAQRLANKYVIDMALPKGYKDISASFVDVFSPNYDDKSFLATFDDTIVGRKTKKIKVNFSVDVFFKAVEENSQIRKEVFTKDDIRQLERLATLYGVDELVIAYAVINSYDGYTFPHLNYEEVGEAIRERAKFRGFKSKISSKIEEDAKIEGTDSLMAQKITYMETHAPRVFLKALQNNKEPSEYDLEVIDAIALKYDLPNGVMNALIEFTLSRCDDRLVKNYMDRVAATMVRKNIKTAIDAMNYLSSKKVAVKKVAEQDEAKVETKPVETKKETIAKTQIEEISDSEIDDLIKRATKKGKK